MADNITNMRDFTLSESFKDLPEFAKQLHKENKKHIINISPGLSAMEPPGSYEPFESASKRGIFVMNPKTNKPLEGKCWQNRTVWIDFSHPNATSWWTEEIVKFHKILPFDGLWTVSSNKLRNLLIV